MDKATVIATLKRHEAELRELGIERLSIFGSIARDEATEASDVDFAALLAPGPRGFARLERIDRIKGRLSKILRRRVDLIEEPSPSPRVQQEIDRDRVTIFAPERTGQASVDVLAAIDVEFDRVRLPVRAVRAQAMLRLA